MIFCNAVVVCAEIRLAFAEARVMRLVDGGVTGASDVLRFLGGMTIAV